MSQIRTDQVSAAIIQQGITQKQAEMANRLAEIQQVAAERVEYARAALDRSLGCVESVRDFASDTDHILGSDLTKHGEIAEHIEVEIRNGRDILNHIEPTATFEGVGRTAPEDYIIDGVNVQSKFINGANKSLGKVLGHLGAYPDFAENGYYHIPKDQYELVAKIAAGERPEGVTIRTIERCKALIRQIESQTGKDFHEVVRPGISTYSEVQLGKVDETLDGYEQEFKDRHAKEVEDIKAERDAQSDKAQHIADPSWGEALKYSAVIAVISGTALAGVRVYAKVREGKKISQFDLSDWKEVGYDFVKGGVKGGVSGLAIYGLTKLGGMSAPFAGAVVSSAMGVASLAMEYRRGNISKVDFYDSACALSVDAGMAAVGATIGQTIIPIPVLGAIVGTAVAKAALEIGTMLLNDSEAKLIAHMRAQYDEVVKSLTVEAQEIIAKMDEYYAKLGGYIDAALSVESAVRFYGSIELCRMLNVSEPCIIHNLAELDEFMLQ